MKIPEPLKINRDFTLTAVQAKKWRLGNWLVGLKVSDWNNLDSLAAHALTWTRKNAEVTAEWSMGVFITSLDNIASKYISHTELRHFASKLKLYLATDDAKVRYNKVLLKLQLKKDNKKAGEELELIVETNAMKSAALTGLKRSWSLDSEIREFKAADIDDNSDEEEDTEPIRKQKRIDTSISISNVKAAIYNKAKELHSTYKVKKLTPDQRKLMSCGGSLILDLVDQTDDNEFKKLFTTEIWDALNIKFKSMLLACEANISETLMEKFKYGARLALTGNRCEDSTVYFSSIYCQQTMTRIQRGNIKLYMTIFNILQNSSYILQGKYKKNISEGNYLTEIWFPVLKSLFAINGNLIRLKCGETIPGDSTEEKSKLYVGEKHIIGFKTDIRFIYDYEDSEFDIGALEVCLPDAEDDKVTDDEAKLLHEGKSMAKALHHVSSGDIDVSWIIQVSGLKVYFSTLSYVGHDLYVGLLQNEVSFPSSISELNDDVKIKSFFQGLFKLRDNIEKCVHIIQRNIKQTNDNQNTTYDKFHDSGFQSPPYRNLPSESQTWYTPPNENRTRSVFAGLNSELLKSGDDVIIHVAGSSHSSSDEFDDESENSDIDSHGFIRSGNQWYNPLTDTYFDHHPYY